MSNVPINKEDARAFLDGVMSKFTVSNLKGISQVKFKKELDRYLALDDMGQFDDPTVQRDQEVRFAWGHDHDFGKFQINGLLHDRHLDVLAQFISMGGLPLDLSDKVVFDVGCWTGGTSLLLAGMGAQVSAIEEVPEYAEAARHLATSFGASVEVDALSVYNLPGGGNLIDYVLAAGVIYHVSDPLLALRLLYSYLKVGGTLLLEGVVTALGKGGAKVLEYRGPSMVGPGSLEDRNRQGWCWYLPSPAALLQMVVDVGFTVGQVYSNLELGTVYIVAHKNEEKDMLRAGLADREVR